MTMTADAPVLLHKAMTASGVKVLDDEHGIVEAYVAGIGNKDSVGDIIQPGAFIESLGKRMPKGVWSHNWDLPIAKTLEIYEVSPGDPRLPVKMASRGVGGLYVKTQFNLETQRGRDAYSDVKFFGDESEWSIGYAENETEYSKELGANLLHKIDLYEYSPVLFGANPLTSTVGIKVEFDADRHAKIVVTGLNNEALEAKVAEAVKGAIETKTVPEPEGSKAGIDESEPVVEVEASEKSEPVVETETEVADGLEKSEQTDLETGSKSVPGSYEARQNAIREAIQDIFPGCYAWIVATFDTTVVAEVYESYGAELAEVLAGTEGSEEDETEDEDMEGYWMFSYVVAGDNEVTLSNQTRVDVVEVVVAKAAMDQLAAKDALTDEIKAEISGKIHTEIINVFAPGVEGKAGRVLSAKNLDRLTAAKTAIEEVLGSADAKEPESEEKTVQASIDGDEEAEPKKGVVEDEEKVNPNAPHKYVEGDDGKCEVCGKAKGNDMHDGKSEEGAVEGEKAEETADSPALTIHEFKGEEESCDECSQRKDAWIHSETAKALLETLTAESPEKAAEFAAFYGKAAMAQALVASLPADSEKSEEQDEDFLATLTALDAAVVAMVAPEDDSKDAIEQLTEAHLLADSVIKAFATPETDEEESTKNASLVEVDAATLLDLEILLADMALDA